MLNGCAVGAGLSLSESSGAIDVVVGGGRSGMLSLGLRGGEERRARKGKDAQIVAAGCYCCWVCPFCVGFVWRGTYVHAVQSGEEGRRVRGREGVGRCV